jgi:hypothetical protein
VTKPTEFVDTYFMLVKGNYRQVTWLHISHHAVMPLIMTTLLQLVRVCCLTLCGVAVGRAAATVQDAGGRCRCASSRINVDSSSTLIPQQP